MNIKNSFFANSYMIATFLIHIDETGETFCMNIKHHKLWTKHKHVVFLLQGNEGGKELKTRKCK